jgi:hypothetical protein
LFAGVVLGVLQAGVIYSEKTWENWYPDYEKQDIRGILSKPTLSDEDYEILYAQTGLTKIGVDSTLATYGKSRILRIQDFYFQEHEMEVNHFNPFTYLEVIDEKATFCAVQEGDIIMSSTTYVSWFRYGHAALIVSTDGETVESTSPGSISEINHINAFARLANFVILRPKIDVETKKQVAQYARDNLVGLPYRMMTGIFTKKYKDGEAPKYTQCAHIVWSAYKHFGIDLDSTGGRVVKPQDMYLSDEVEIVQIFGFHPETIWEKD